MTLDNIVGQDRTKRRLQLLKERFEKSKVLPPIGIFAAKGLGKTFIIEEFADELKANLIYLNGTAIKDSIAFRAFFKEAEDDQEQHHIMFIDECHELPKKVQENLLSVLEKPSVLCTVATKEMGWVNTLSGRKWIDKGDVIRQALPKNLTFVFATTDRGRMKATVLDRLKELQLEPYDLEDKMEVAMNYLAKSGLTTEITIYEALARRSRSMRHLKSTVCDTYLDLVELRGKKDLESLDLLLGIDEDGATDQDLDYMTFLGGNKVVGLDTMAGYLRCEKREIIEQMEPFMLEKQWIRITGKGRILTSEGATKVYGEDCEQVD